MNNPGYFALLILIFLLIQTFFSMLEMASVSFNKVRLQYYVTKGKKRAIWLSWLIKNPSRLFGTTLIGVNAALQFGSEAARRFYASLGLSPDLAPISQLFLVLLLAELAPMIAARRYAEHVGMLGAGLLYFSSMLFAPIIWVLNALCRAAYFLFRIKASYAAFPLTREEIQKVIEERDEGKRSEFDATLENIFALKERMAIDIMRPLQEAHTISLYATTKQVREILASSYMPYMLLYQKSMENITGIIYPRDLLRLSEDQSMKEISRPPWFITHKNSIFQILKQFRWNNQTLAVVLNENGTAVGILTLEDILNEIFEVEEGAILQKEQIFLERTFSGDMLVQDINARYLILLPFEPEETLQQLMTRHLGHFPKQFESVSIDGIELIAEEASLLEVAKVRIRTISD